MCFHIIKELYKVKASVSSSRANSASRAIRTKNWTHKLKCNQQTACPGAHSQMIQEKLSHFAISNLGSPCWFQTTSSSLTCIFSLYNCQNYNMESIFCISFSFSLNAPEELSAELELQAASMHYNCFCGPCCSEFAFCSGGGKEVKGEKM